MWSIMLGMEIGVLFGSVVSCCNLLCMMFRAGSTGTEVKRAFMSYDDIVSPLNLDGFGLFYKVWAFLIWWGKHLPEVQRMFVISLPTPYMIEPLLDTMGLRGCLFCGFEVSHRIWGWMHK